MKAKNVISFFCAVLMLASLFTASAMAAEQNQRIVDLGDGFYVVQTVKRETVTRAGNIVSGKVSGELYYEDTQIGSATLTAAFDISGSSAVALAAVLEGKGMNGFTYRDAGTYCGGNRATGVAIFESSSVFKQLPLEIRCTPDGELY